MLLASAHASSNERPFARDQSAPHAFARYIVQAFKPISHIHLALFTPADTQAEKSADDAALMRLHDVVTVPTIQDVVFDQDGSAHLRGRGAPGVTIALQSNGRRLAEGRVSKTGTWDITLDRHLTHGVHRVQSIAFRPGDDHHVRGADVRLALPQSLLNRPVDQAGPAAAHAHGESLPSETIGSDVSSWRIAQAGGEGSLDQNRRQRERDQSSDSDEFGAPFFNWLRRSSEIYGDVIVPDLSGEDRGLAFVHPGGRALVEKRERFVNPGEGRRRQSERRRQRNGIVDQLTARWQNFSVGVSEWLRQARETYRAEIADELSVGARRARDVARRREQEDEDRVARTEPEIRRAPVIETPDISREAPSPSPPPEPQPAPQVRDETPAIEPRAKLEEWPVVDVTPREEKPTPAPATPSRSFEWPVVTESEVKPEPLPEVKPDPKNEALIRQAEEDAARARELARQAAERAEQTRRETEALLAEERRLNEEIAKRAAAEKAARENALQKRLSEADERAADARRQAAESAEVERQREREERARAEAEDAERASERARVAAEAERVRLEAQRRAAEALAAAATEEADEKFRSGEVPEPGEIARAKPRQGFTVAETVPPPRGSVKDTVADAEVEEGSTLGDVDDFDPSVRYVYDMGDAAPPKVKRKKRTYKRAYRKRSAKRRAYKKKRSAKRRAYRARKYKKRRARARRGYKSRRSYRTRRYSYRRRFVRYRMSLGARRFLRSFTRGVRVRTRGRCGRRHAMRRKIYMQRARWRRR